MGENEDIDVKFWFNVETHEVERGEHSNFTKLIGPYDTRAEAEKALEKVKLNNKQWDEDQKDEDDR
jgi:hypothetical protein